MHRTLCMLSQNRDSISNWTDYENRRFLVYIM
jgi:hypothetical protein